MQAVRDTPAPFWALESLLREYPISSAEGLALMRLAEALLRVPDVETAVALTADQLGRARFDGDGDSPHRLLATLSSSAIGLAKRWLPEVGEPPGLLERLGAKTVVAATVRAIQLLGRQFVLGRDIDEALDEAAAAAARATAPAFFVRHARRGCAHRARRAALPRVVRQGDPRHRRAASAMQARRRGLEHDGISIKLSALHPRYEDAHHARVMAELVPRLAPLLDLAAAADINLTIDAEESDRLELSLQVFDALASHVQQQAPRWRGFGLAVQAYQTRVLEVIDEVARIARARQLRFMVSPGQGRLLGWRDQARAGRWPRGLPGVHAQAAHRHRLPGRARARCSGTTR